MDKIEQATAAPGEKRDVRLRLELDAECLDLLPALISEGFESMGVSGAGRLTVTIELERA